MKKTSIKFTQPFSLVLISMLWLLSGCNEQAPAQKTTVNAVQGSTESTEKHAKEFVILALGDSLTEGLGVKQSENYPAILERNLKQQGFDSIKVINSGLSGETSSGLKARLDWVLQLKPQLTILNIGANDAMRGLPLALTTSNIDEIISRIKASGSEVILAGMQIYDNLGREYVTGFKDMYPQLAEQHELTMIPFFLDHVAGNPQLNQADMIHPTAAGYAVIVEKNIMPLVLPELAKTLPTQH